jgi:hypothetical protein
MAKKLVLFISFLLIFGIVLYLSQLSKEHSSKSCVLQILADNSIKKLSLVYRTNQIIIKGQTSASTKDKIQNLSFSQCGNNEVITEISLNDNALKHTAWLQFEIDEFNKLIAITGKLKKQNQVKEVLEIFSDNFPNETLAHDIEIDVLITPNSPLISHISYLLPSISPIKMARIKLTDTTLKLEGLIRDTKRENLLLSKLKQLFINEVSIENQLEKVIKENNNIKSLEFSLPEIPPIEQTSLH